MSLIPEPFSYTFLFSLLSVGSDEVTENYSIKKEEIIGVREEKRINPKECHSEILNQVDS